MAELIVTLPEHLREFVGRQVAEGGHASPEAYLVALLNNARKQAARERLESLLIEGLDSGPAVEADAKFWEDLRREVDEEIRERAGS